MMTYYGGCAERDDIDKCEELGNLAQTVISSLGRDEQNKSNNASGRSYTYSKAYGIGYCAAETPLSNVRLATMPMTMIHLIAKIVICGASSMTFQQGIVE